MAEGVRLPVRECVGDALRFARAHIGFCASLAAVGAVGVTSLSALSLFIPATGVGVSLASSILETAIYAAIVGASLWGAAAVQSRLTGDTARMWAAMAFIGFFLFIVCVVLTFPLMFILFSGPMAPYMDDIAAAGQDETAMMRILTQFATANPGWLLACVAIYAMVWFGLTSRLFVSAPATLDQKRILTFETWHWTKGSLLNIAAARLMLLTPAFIFVNALIVGIGRLAGRDVLNPEASLAAAQANPLLTLLTVAVSAFISFLVYLPLEAGLSTAIYRRLRPNPATVFA